MAMRIAPPEAHSKTFTHLPSSSSTPSGAAAGAPSAPGVHDTLRAGLGPSSSFSSTPTTTPSTTSTHPLEARLSAWQATQDALKMESLRRTFGIAEPIRRGMELKIAREGDWRPMALSSGGRGKPGLHEDILAGRDNGCTWEDVFSGGEEAGKEVGFHEEVERKVGMGSL